MEETPSLPDPWSNLSASPHDEETAGIDRLEGGLRDISESVRGVRQLITRFEPCHFKCLRHFEQILRSIDALEAATAAETSSRYEALCGWIAGDSALAAGVPVKRAPTKVWLVACLAKTIKEQCSLKGVVDVAGLMAKPEPDPP